jgi:hypothetical protein
MLEENPFYKPPVNKFFVPPEGRVKPPPAQTATGEALDKARLDKVEQDIREGQLGAGAKPEHIPPAAAAMIQDKLVALKAIDEALAALAARPESIGIGTGWLGDTATQINDPEGTTVRAKVAKIGAVTLHDLSGAAVSASETPRFTPFVPQAKDKASVARDKLMNFRKALEQDLTEHFDYYGPANSYLPYNTPGADEFRRGDRPPPPAINVPPETKIPGAVVGPYGQTSTMLNIGDLGEEPRPGGPVIPADAQPPVPPPPREGNLLTTSSDSKAYPGEETVTIRRNGQVLGQFPAHMIQSGDETLQPNGQWELNIVGGSVGSPEDLRRKADKARADALRKEQDEGVTTRDEGPLGILPGSGGPAGEGPRERLLKHGMTLGLTDEAAGLGQGLAHPFSFLENYRAGRDVEQGRIDEARDQTGWGGTAAELAGGLISLNPETMVSGLGRVAQLTQSAKQAGVASALAGWGEGKGAEESTKNALLYGTVGALTGPLLGEAGRGATTVGRKLRNAVTDRGLNPDLAAAAANNQVRLRKPMVDPRTQELAGNLEGSPGASQIIRGGYADTEADIGAGLTRLSTGAPQDMEVAGGIAQNAATRFLRDTDRRAAVNYGRARQLAGEDAAITPRTALLQLRKELLEFKGTENISADQVAFINRVGEDLTKGPVTIKQFQRIRRELNDAITRGELRGSEADRATQRIINALRDDLHDSLPRPAAKRFLEADAQYSKDLTFQNDILLPFVAKNAEGELKMSSSQAMSKLQAWANQKSGDPRRLQAFWDNMKPAERQDVLASVISALGKPNRTADFSAAHFISQVSGLSNSARRTMFGVDGAQRVNELVELSKALGAARSRINFPGSGRTLKQHIGSMLGLMLIGGGGGSFAGGGGAMSLTTAGGAVAGLLAKSGIDALRAKSLMNPRFSAWLADVARAATPAQMNERVRKLGVIIAREPALRDELEPLKKKLDSVFGPTQAPAKLTAEDTVQ